MAADDLLSRKQAAAYLCQLGVSISPKTLENKANHRNSGKGPAFIKIGWRQVKYRRSELDAWARAQMEEIR